MGNYEQLKQSVSDVIKTNGNQEITGSILQNVLLTIISSVGANATFAGIATPTTNPGTPDGPVFYLASESGTYTNFGGIELQDGLSVLLWNDSSWSSQQIFSIDYEPTAGSDNLVKSGGVFLQTSDRKFKKSSLTIRANAGVKKLIDYKFKAGETYKLDLVLSNIEATENIAFALRYSTNAGLAMFYNITGSQIFEYTPINDHDAVYCSCYDGTCDAQLTVSTISKNRRTISIIGDDISTFKDFILSGYNFEYPKGNVDDMNKTWWKQYIDISNGKLEVNASTNGSGVCNKTVAQYSVPSLYERASLIGSPSEIVIALGTHDNQPVGNIDYDADIASYSESEFAPALIKGIKQIYSVNPQTRIVYVIFKTVNNSYVSAINQICNHYNIEVVSFKDINYSTVDTYHPDSDGMKKISSVLSTFNIENTLRRIKEVENEIPIVDPSLNVSSHNAIENSAVTSAINSANAAIAELGDKEVISRPSIITVAAYNSSTLVKNAADYVCNGTDDQYIINEAIAQLPETGGEVHLSGGLFLVSAPILIDKQIKLTGEGNTSAGIPGYTPTSGIDYSQQLYNNGVQNLYGRTAGGTTIRATADCHVIQIGSVVRKKISITFRDFLVQGYGKDRHTKCGIYGKCSTDVSVIDNIGVYECYIGVYLKGDDTNSNHDAIRITNSAFQWNGCALVSFGAWQIVANNCIADCNGIASYTDDENNTLSINCGGAFLQGTGLQVHNNIFVRCVSYTIPNVGGDSVVICGADGAIVSGNQISECAGSGLRVGPYSHYVKVINNRITNFGYSNVPDNKYGIVVTGSQFVEMKNNTIGKLYEGSGGNIDKAIKVNKYKCIISSNTLLNFGNTKINNTTLFDTVSGSFLNENIYFGIQNDVEYSGIVGNS